MKFQGLVWLLLLAMASGCDGTSIVGALPDGGGMDAPGLDVSCAAGQRSCGGRCTDLTVDPAHCGGCGAACASGQACVAGVCELRCPGTQAVCSGQCLNLQTDGSNCGACGRACASGQVCSLGRCSTTCDATLATCSSAGDGGVGATYCVDARTDRLNCGACGNVCAAGHVCVDRVCRLSCAGEQRDCGGTCRDLQSDNAHCGACGNACPPGNTCAMGACAVSCSAGLTQCGATCANLQTDNANCGACGTTCAAGSVCSGGACGTTCASPATTCGTAPSRLCANTAIDPAHCGGCGMACSLAHTMTQGCTGGECAVVRCAAGYGDCDGTAPNGCETDTATSAAHCGGCGRACLLPHATTACAAGACGVVTCDAGFADCDRVASNGCEVDTRTDNAHCGACGTGCAAGSVCSAGVCGATCAAPLATCGTAGAAFCANTAIDPTNCGACGTVCALPHVSTHGCAGGVCSPSRCGPGFGDCDGLASNGCETDTTTSATSCGACGRTCALPNATATCTVGACAVMACATGFSNCDGNPANGCEVDTRSDNASCGACGRACSAGSVCSGGVCGTTCASPLATCGTAPSAFCANTAVDPANCGGCGTLCSLSNVAAHGCASGACTVVRCNAGAGDCNGTASDGCETNLQTTLSSCGACGRSCSLPHATSTCTAGACAISSCATGFVDCDLVAANGCEVDTRSDNAHCGSCTTVCAGGTMCSGGVCGATCQASQANCSGTCATLASDPSHCGACTTVCPTVPNATPYCAAGACGFACAAGFADCDAMPATGCETNAATVSNCRRCGVACAAPANATAVCAAAGCDYTCNLGFARVGSACLATPRPIAPLSTATVTSRRPTLRWVLPEGDAVHLELCRDRALTSGCMTADVTDLRWSPSTDLSPGVWFWRLTKREGGVTTTVTGPTWQLVVGQLSAPVDASSGTTLDVNGDGYADLVVGAYPSNVVHVYLGRAGGTPYDPTPITLSAPAGTSYFGHVVASAGDVDGDGYADLVVGAYAVNTVFVYRGGPGSTALTAPPIVLVGDRYFGYSVASAGDVNGDGYGDLIVGASFSYTASLLLGGPNPLSGAPIVISAFIGGNSLGYSVASAGDLNADGFADLVLSKHSDNRVYVYLGRAGSSPLNAPIQLAGPAGSTSFGYSVAGAGDVNADGYSDIVVGLSSSPNAYAYLGGPGATPLSAPITLTEPMGAILGNVVAGAGDVNGDGYADLVLGTSYSVNAAFVFLGGAGASPFVAPPVALRGPSGSNFGTSVSGAGDLNGDGYADIVVGTFGPSQVYVYLGVTGVAPFSAPPITLTGPSSSTLFGTSVASAGDVHPAAPRLWCVAPPRRRSVVSLVGPA